MSNQLSQAYENYSKMEQEYELFKGKLLKEYKLLKNEFVNAKIERDALRNTLLEFKNYFFRFQLTNDGDIIYIE